MDELDKLFSFEQKMPVEPGSTPKEPIPEKTEHSTPSIPVDTLIDLPINLLLDYSSGRDPFRPYSADELESLRNDIRVNGVLQPCIVRPHPKEQGYYEIIAGHNRRNAAASLGYHTLPCIVRDLDDDTAIRQLIATNLEQRTGLLPSEKAWAYRLQMEAMSHQGYRTDLTCAQVGHKSRDDIAEHSGDSREQVRRYIRLTYLLPELLKLVDDKKLPFVVGVELSFLTVAHQTLVIEFFMREHPMPISQSVASTLRELEKQGRLDKAELARLYLTPPTVRSLKSVSFKLKKWQHYFEPTATEKDIVETIEKALTAYFTQP